MDCQELTIFLQKVLEKRGLIQNPVDDFGGTESLIEEIEDFYEKAEQIFRWRGNYTEFYPEFSRIGAAEELIKHSEQHRPFDVSPAGTKIVLSDGLKIRGIDSQKEEEICARGTQIADNNYFIQCYFVNSDLIRVQRIRKSSNEILYDYFHLNITTGNVSGVPFNDSYEFVVEDRDMEFGVQKNTIQYYESGAEKEFPGLKEITKLVKSPSEKFLIFKGGKSSSNGLVPVLGILDSISLETIQMTYDDYYALGHTKDLLATVMANQFGKKIFIQELGGGPTDLTFLMFKDDQIEISQMAFDFDDKNLLVADNRNTIHILSLELRKEIASFQVDLPLPIKWMQTTADHKLIVGCGDNKSWQVKIYKKDVRP